MYFSRNIDKHLLEWKTDKKRKPLLIRGARQVGKSTAVRQLVKQFKYFIEINFEEDKRFSSIFSEANNATSILQQLQIITNTPIQDGDSLLFLDEIQACPQAINELRYFYEKRPNLHVIASGSLLEFALQEIPSFGVGRIRTLFMYPFCFTEFLLATEQNNLLQLLQTHCHSKQAIPLAMHTLLLQQFKTFTIIGGMPQAIVQYVLQQNLQGLQVLHNDYLLGIQTDFAKYKTKMSAIDIGATFNSLIASNGSKYNYSKSGTLLNSKQLKQGIDLLQKASLFMPIQATSASGLPLLLSTQLFKTKYIFLDTGLYLTALGINKLDLINTDLLINKGIYAEIAVALEIIKNQNSLMPSSLFYWQRETQASKAEVDFILQHNNTIIPIEVKSNTTGSMQSLYTLLKEKNIAFGYRCSKENFGLVNNINIIPIYAAGIYFGQKDLEHS
jgi:uncharacterized protein